MRRITCLSEAEKEPIKSRGKESQERPEKERGAKKKLFDSKEERRGGRGGVREKPRTKRTETWGGRESV